MFSDSKTASADNELLDGRVVGFDTIIVDHAFEENAAPHNKRVFLDFALLSKTVPSDDIKAEDFIAELCMNIANKSGLLCQLDEEYRDSVLHIICYMELDKLADFIGAIDMTKTYWLKVANGGDI